MSVSTECGTRGATFSKNHADWDHRPQGGGGLVSSARGTIPGNLCRLAKKNKNTKEEGKEIPRSE